MMRLKEVSVQIKMADYKGWDWQGFQGACQPPPSPCLNRLQHQL